MEVPMPDTTRLSRLQANWVYGGSLAGLLILALLPLFWSGWTTAWTLTFLTLPAYMLHQYEEHDDDRFRQFVNAVIGRGREVLTLADVFFINIVGVWVVLAATFWIVHLAGPETGPGWGLIAAWLILVNALAHIGQGLALRRYNPGLWTAILLFLPLGLLTLRALAPLASTTQQVVSLALAIAIHALIIARVRAALRSGRR
jgi:hypothetical protein